MEVISYAELAAGVAQGVAIVDFAAEWCGPCKQLAASLSELTEIAPEIKVLTVDVDAAPELAARFAVMSVPSILVFNDGELRGSLVGARSSRVLLEEVRRLL